MKPRIVNMQRAVTLAPNAHSGEPFACCVCRAPVKYARISRARALLCFLCGSCALVLLRVEEQGVAP